MLVVEDLLDSNDVGLDNGVRNDSSPIELSAHGVSRLSSDTGHDRNDDVFFNREWTRINVNTEEPDVRNVACPCFANRETQ